MDKKISEASNEELQGELKRREVLEQLRQVDEAKAINEKIFAVLTQEVVDALVPKHANSRCSDNDHFGADWTDSGAARCKRCILLDALSMGYLDPEVQLTIEIRERQF